MILVMACGFVGAAFFWDLLGISRVFSVFSLRIWVEQKAEAEWKIVVGLLWLSVSLYVQVACFGKVEGNQKSQGNDELLWKYKKNDPLSPGIYDSYNGIL